MGQATRKSLDHEHQFRCLLPGLGPPGGCDACGCSRGRMLAWLSLSTLYTIYENDTSCVISVADGVISRFLASWTRQLPLRGVNAEGKAFSLANSDSPAYHNVFSIGNPLFPSNLQTQPTDRATAAGKQHSTPIWGTGWEHPRKLGEPLCF